MSSDIDLPQEEERLEGWISTRIFTGSIALALAQLPQGQLWRTRQNHFIQNVINQAR